ncbi:MAG: class I SAM-dependent methyltransferase [Acidobacteriia bacterium]|nr:class I SAM-dependent methyltransferase [Terriglobia bacterium]
MAYENFADVADDYWRTFGPEFHVLIQGRLEAWLRRYGIRPHRVLDLGCGTGSLAVEWARQDYQMTGVDVSAAALRIARKKARSARVRVRFIRTDLRKFALPSRFDLAVSIFNTVNHVLSVDGLQSMFRCVAKALNPSGWFVFDVNNASCFRRVWGGISVVDHPRFVLVRQDQLDFKNKKASAHLMIYKRRHGGFIRGEDLIRETWFDHRLIRRIAVRAGFQVVHKEDFNPFDGGKRDSKIKSLWLLRKV